MIHIILVTIIIILLLVFANHFKEKFFSENIQFLEVKNACDILKTINYSYNNLDIKLRKITSDYKKNIYKFYCDHLLEFNNVDKKLIKWVVNGMKERLPEHLLFILKNLKFAKFQNNIEHGYPHTNKDVIFLTDGFISSLYKYYNTNNIEEAIKDIGAIIIHEAVHVWQRKETNNFNDLYKNYWKFVKVNKIYNSKELESVKRYNPDGVDTNWVFSLRGKHILFLSIYSKEAKHIGHVDYIGIYLEKSGNKFIIPKDSKHYNLNNMDEFNYFFKDLYGNHYHPNEISAELISIYYLKMMNISHHNYKNIAYSNMLLWLKKLI